jgi:hypothetical protein
MECQKRHLHGDNHKDAAKKLRDQTLVRVRLLYQNPPRLDKRHPRITTIPLSDRLQYKMALPYWSPNQHYPIYQTRYNSHYARIGVTSQIPLKFHQNIPHEPTNSMRHLLYVPLLLTPFMIVWILLLYHKIVRLRAINFSLFLLLLLEAGLGQVLIADSCVKVCEQERSWIRKEKERKQLCI